MANDTEPKLEPVLMENVRIIFRNFSGKEGPYNRAGDRNFAVLLDEETAQAMAADDWNVKWLKPRDDDEDPTEQAYLPVAVGYNGRRSPKIVLVTTDTTGNIHRSSLGENEVEMLDWVDIINVDLIVNPSRWDVNGKTGVKAYLRSIFVTINEDPLDKKYAEMADKAGQSPLE